MATLFHRFEIQSELSNSDTARIYKALDKETNQVVALKTQDLSPLGTRAMAFVETLIAEGEKVHGLSSQNIVQIFGAGEIDGQFCASMDYIQGNSIATMLSRKEGFSIWDLLDISRQACATLHYAGSQNVIHSSLEPAKIMVQWDGMVKILGYGISNMGLIAAASGQGLGQLTPYCSPEQIRGEAIDQRSNLFTLGTILYEMVVGRKAFLADDPVAVVHLLQNEMPPSPSSINPKIQPAVSDVIMKALAKNPAERYQSARELLEDLEKSKENKTVAAPVKKSAAPPSFAVDPSVRAAAASKFVATGASGNEANGTDSVPSPLQNAPSAVKANAAAAGAGSSANPASASASASANQRAASSSVSRPAASSGSKAISEFEVSSPHSNPVSDRTKEANKTQRAVSADPLVSSVAGPAAKTSPATNPAPYMSSSVASTPSAAGQLITDPMMSGPVISAPPGSGRSFSDLAEMPPLKEVVYAPPVNDPVEQSRSTVQIYPKKEEKPKVQPREVAGKALKEIRTVPPQLMLYSTLGAVVIILVIAVAIFFHVRSADDDSTAAPRLAKSSQPAVDTQTQPPTTKPAPPIVIGVDPQPSLSVRQVDKRAAKNNRRQPVAPVVLASQALIDSTPQGAQFQVDGKSNPAWITPFTLAEVSPGKHIISASKTGYGSEIRSLEVVAGSTSSLVFHLAAINAVIVVNSIPPGAAITLDGKPTGHLTPSQFSVEKGAHTVALRKQGYLDETASADLAAGQNFQYAPALRALGNAEDIRTVGKLNKLFSHGGESTAGMGAISIRTQPKGAQVSINQRVLDKMSPIDVMVGPGNYVVDITMTGFKSVHKVVVVDKGSKAAIDETLDRQ
jgi:serine/threonine protein kinase